MDTLRLETDELTGLQNWPVLFNGNWSQWTDEPCAILFGETCGWENNEALQLKVGELLRSPEWPRLTPFRLGRGGFLVLAHSYSSEQALLLAQSINRILGENQFVRSPWESSGSQAAKVTWSIAVSEEGSWNLPRTLQEAISAVQRAVREKRFGSINGARSGGGNHEHDDFWVCSRRDALTELNLWSHTAALCSRYKDEPVALLLGDVDYQKSVNDIYGLPIGELHLQLIAHVLRRFESNDVAIFRIGGDEFLVWMRGHSLGRAKQLAEQINTQLSTLQIPIPGSDASISKVSLTWAVVATSARDIELKSILCKADELLRQTKDEQRGSVSAQRI
ncbi:diguanylate cyclase [bacterium]|nr:MAG: diguanylate cyclase [bacterium]